MNDAGCHRGSQISVPPSGWLVNKEVINNQLSHNSRHAFLWECGKSGPGSSFGSVPTLPLWGDIWAAGDGDMPR